ncbi:MAG: DUF5069 domain-containing protein [Verrucomicrobiales bacterium]
MSDYSWNETFLELFDRCRALYSKGEQDFRSYYNKQDQAFLAAIGCKPREFFDFVEDNVDGGEPGPTTALLIASVRRDYFLHVQKGEASSKEMQTNELPGRQAELDGIPWLPRILQKARNKLRGENSPDIMYGCGGDRAFLSLHGLHPADFLRVVWAAGEDDKRVVDFVRRRR